MRAGNRPDPDLSGLEMTKARTQTESFASTLPTDGLLLLVVVVGFRKLVRTLEILTSYVCSVGEGFGDCPWEW